MVKCHAILEFDCFPQLRLGQVGQVLGVKTPIELATKADVHKLALALLANVVGNPQHWLGGHVDSRVLSSFANWFVLQRNDRPLKVDVL